MSLSTVRTGTPDATTGIQIAEVSAQAGGVLPAGLAASDMVANGPSAHRTVTAADSATDMSSAGFGSAGQVLNDNRGAILVWCDFAGANDAITLRPIFYDNAATKAPMAVGPSFTLMATARRKAAAGNYMSEPVLIETYGFASFKMFAEALSSTSTNIYAVPV